eukprot:2017663-Alexandrium_andersonii.AAC.1
MQRAVAELLTPDCANSATALQPALLWLKGQLRGTESPGHPIDDAQHAIALQGLLPQPLLDRLDDIEDDLNAFELELKWVGRQVERGHVRALTGKSRARIVHE